MRNSPFPVFLSGGAVCAAPSKTARSRSLLQRPVAHACLLACMVGLPAAYAEEPDSDPRRTATVQASDADFINESTLHEVTVRTTHWNGAVQDMASPVQVLADQALEWRRAATLGETLANEPGVHASHFGAGASRPVIRGMDGPRVQVLSDGSPAQDASTVSPDHAVMADAMLATQIEVLRGPSALLYGGAVGGVVNVIDDKIPTAVPENGLSGSAQARYSSADRGSVGSFALTGGEGPLVVHVQGMGRNAQDYRVGAGWAGGDRVPGSYSSGETGSLGLSWVGSEGYLGLAYTRQTARYGLPGHSHADCHPHGDTLHCHDDHDHDHDHDHGDGDEVPAVNMRSNRWDLRGAWRNPVAGIEAVRLSASHTRYGHEELEAGTVATQFRNRAHDLRLEVQHAPIAGLSGVVGVQLGQRRFSAEGEEAYVQPTDTRKWGVFMLERYQLGDWSLQGALRYDHQRIRAQDSQQERTHSGGSASLGAVWKFQPGWQASLSYTHASRLPTAEELFANGPHLATNAWERGDSGLRRETSRAWDLGLRQTAGDTSWSVSLYRHQVGGYIYGRTLAAQEGFQLLQYAQTDARFTGLEGQVRQRLNAVWAVSVFGDAVRAQRADGSALPRIPPARLGLRVEAQWQGWQGQAEWIQSARQSRVAPLETTTPGFGMLNLSAAYTLHTPQGQPLQLFVKAANLTNQLAYVHTSFIKDAAPLTGRSITLGVKMDF